MHKAAWFLALALLLGVLTLSTDAGSRWKVTPLRRICFTVDLNSGDRTDSGIGIFVCWLA